MKHNARFSNHASWITSLLALVLPDEVVALAACGWQDDTWESLRQQSYPQRVALPALAAEPELKAAMRWAGLRAGMKVLDAGCGAGVISRFLWEEGASEVNGVDNDDAMLSQAAALP